MRKFPTSITIIIHKISQNLPRRHIYSSPIFIHPDAYRRAQWTTLFVIEYNIRAKLCVIWDPILTGGLYRFTEIIICYAQHGSVKKKKIKLNHVYNLNRYLYCVIYTCFIAVTVIIFFWILITICVVLKIILNVAGLCLIFTYLKARIWTYMGRGVKGVF